MNPGHPNAEWMPKTSQYRISIFAIGTHVCHPQVNALEGELAAAQQRLSHFTAVARTAVESGLARHQGQDGGSLYQGSSSPRFSSPGSSKRASAEHTAALLALLGALRDTDVSYTSLTQEERGTSLSRIRLLQVRLCVCRVCASGHCCHTTHGWTQDLVDGQVATPRTVVCQ